MYSPDPKSVTKQCEKVLSHASTIRHVCCVLLATIRKGIAQLNTRLGVSLLLASILLSGACTNIPDPVAKAAAMPMWPQFPDQPRYLYETVLLNSRSIEQETEWERQRRTLTGASKDVSGFKKPLGVAARGGRIYVSDTEGRRVHVFDVPRRRYFTFGFRGDGVLQKPIGISIDASGNVYVADVGMRRVVKYDGMGRFLAAFGSATDLERPTGVGVSPRGDRVYVVDAGGVDSDKHQVVAYDGEGKKLFAIGSRGKEDGRFNLPVDAAVAPDGTLYVLDAGNFRVQAFDRDGRFLRAFGKVGSGPGQFSRPRGIAVDRDANVYVTDAGFGNVQLFDSTGRLLLALGERGLDDAPGRYRLPSGVAVDETGRVYVVDQFYNKIEVVRRLSNVEGERMLAAFLKR